MFLNLEKKLTSTREKTRFVLKCFLLLLVSKTIVVVLKVAMSTFVYSESMPFTTQVGKLTDFFSLNTALLLVIVILPLLEELAFRSWFSKNRFLVALGVSFLVFYIVQVIFWIRVYEILIPRSLLLFAAFMGPAFLLSLIYHKSLIQIVANNRIRLISFSILSFTVIHSFNYDLKYLDFSTAPALAIALLPHFVGAAFYTYVRLKAGFAWSCVITPFE